MFVETKIVSTMNSVGVAWLEGEHSAMVPQVSNLLYRRFPIGRARIFPGTRRTKPCRLEALRYSRLETCAT